MAKNLTKAEHELLVAAHGDTVAVHGTCICEGSSRVPQHVVYVPQVGTLVDWEVDPVTNEIHSITLQTDEGLIHVCLHVEKTDFAWDKEMVVYHNGVRLFNVVSEN
jgi:hypothetical protein